MSTTKTTHSLRVTGLVGLAAALTLGSTTTTAMADDTAAAASTVEIVSAAVQLSGVGLAIELELKCPPDSQETYLDVQVTQVGESGAIIRGAAGGSVPCTGELETHVAGATPFDPETGQPSAPFEVAPAFVSVRFDTCSFSGCTSTADNETVPLTDTKIDNPSYESDDLTLKLPRRGTMEASGAGVLVLVPYTCATGVDGFFDAVLAQRVAGGVVQLSQTGAGMTCTALDRRGVLAFHAVGHAWHKGRAFLSMAGYACGASTCQYPTAFRTIRVS